METDSVSLGHGEASRPRDVASAGSCRGDCSVGNVDAEGAPLADYRELVGEVRAAMPGAVSALFAVETALLDAYCRDRGIPLSELFGGAPTPVTTDITVPIVTPDAAPSEPRAPQRGLRRHQVKTGGAIDDDVARTVAVADAAPDARSGGRESGLDAEGHRAFVDEVTAAGVDLALVEQPTPRTISAVSRGPATDSRSPSPRTRPFTPADATAVVRDGAADVINVKLGKSGLLGAAAIAAIAEAASLDCMLGCMLEGATGIATSAHLAAGLGAFDYVDLDGHLSFEECPPSMSSGPRSISTGRDTAVSPPAAVSQATEY